MIIISIQIKDQVIPQAIILVAILIIIKTTLIQVTTLHFKINNKILLKEQIHLVIKVIKTTSQLRQKIKIMICIALITTKVQDYRLEIEIRIINLWEAVFSLIFDSKK